MKAGGPESMSSAVSVPVCSISVQYQYQCAVSVCSVRPVSMIHHVMPLCPGVRPTLAINITVADNSQVNHAITFCFPFQDY